MTTRAFQRLRLHSSRFAYAAAAGVQQTLQALSLSAASAAENIALGGAVGTILGARAGSTLSLVGTAGGRFDLSAGAIQRGATALDYETAASHDITVRETNAAYPNSPRDTVLTINVTNVFEQANLSALTLSTSTLTVGASATVNILGATAGSVITGTVPPGMTLNSAARTITGTPTTANAAFAWSLTETLADSANSPRTSGGSLNVQAASSPISAVAADGWQATMVTPADLALAPVSVSRQGFDATGTAATIIESILTTKRVRQPYPNQASLTASSVALSDYIYSTDTVAGVTNSSAETSPKPVANIVTPHRLVVGNTIGGSACPVEIAAFHRNASGKKQVAAVRFIISDGANPAIEVVVAGTTVSGRVGDRNAVPVHALPATDISALNAGLITVNAKVYPRIGGAASVADSAADGNAARGFSPRYFLKNTAAKTLFYVKTAANGGNDTTGAGSTVAATASASPFATILAAINAAHTALAATSGVDMAEIRIGDDGGTPFVLGTTAATRTQKIAALTITRDPAVARANARVSFGAAVFRPRLGGSLTAPLTTGALLFRDLAIVRTGTGAFTGEAAAQLETIFDDCSFDNASNNAAWLVNAHDYHLGTTFTNLSGVSAIGASTGVEHRLLRGISLQPAFVANGMSVEGWCVVGSVINNARFVRGSLSQSGGVCAFNTLTQPPSTAPLLEMGLNQDVAGYAFLQNLIEYTSATTGPTLAISPDSGTGNNSHVILHNNTFAGAFQAGRWNAFYDEGATRRTSKLQSVVGNIAVAIYTKGDLWRGEAQAGADASSATGNWAFSHGVGCRDNFSQFQSNTPIGGNEAQDYAGIGANYGGSQTVRNDPVFTSYQGTTVAAGPVYTAGAGGGTYTLQGVSPARAMVEDPVLSHGLNGNARTPTNDAAGAYAA